MPTFVRPLFAKSKLKLTETSRAVTPFGGLVRFIPWHQHPTNQHVHT